MNHQRTCAYGVAVAAVVGLAACSTTAGSQGAPPSRSSPRASATSPAPASPSVSSAAAKPAVTESNPPGDIPDNQAFVAYTPARTPLTVKVPEGWARASSGSTTTFTDKLNRVTLTVSASPHAPTQQSVNATDVVALQASVPKFALGHLSTTHRAGQSVLLLTYQGDSAPNDVTGKVVRDAFERYTYYRAGKRLDLTLSGPTNADNVDPWKIVSDSVRWS